MGTCEYCKYWKETGTEKDERVGACKRYPPVIIGLFAAGQPQTYSKTECGEFGCDIQYLPFFANNLKTKAEP
jgi:hypothetical protein